MFAKKRGLNQASRAAGPRRPRRRASSPPTAEPVLADRHHRAPHRRGQALPLRDQGRVLQQDRRLLDRLPDEGVVGGGRAAQRGRRCAPGRNDRALRPGQSIPVPEVRPCAVAQRVTRIDGPGRCMRRQCRDGVVLRAAAEERPGSATLVAPGTNYGWRSSPGSSGPTTASAGNAASGSSPRSSSRQSTGPQTRPEPLNPTSQPKWGQSRPRCVTCRSSSRMQYRRGVRH